MAKKQTKKTADAVSILHRRYVQDDAQMEAMLEEERSNADIARKIYQLREQAQLTQGELAQLIGTSRTVISRLEDADYEGHSLSLLRRVAAALDHRVTIQFVRVKKQLETA